jgi:hypothetical protein
VVHSLAFEQEWTAVLFGKKTLRAGPWGCTMSQAFILDERQGALSLDFLCKQYFGIELKAISHLDRKKLASYPVKDVLNYNALDSKFHRELYIVQRKRLKQEGLTVQYKRHLRRIPTCVLTQIKGVPVC